MRAADPTRARARARVGGLRWEAPVILTAAIVAWEVAARRGAIDVLFFPPPTAWGRALATMAADGTLAGDLAGTGRRLALGLLLGLSAGWLLGISAGWSDRARRIVDPFVAGFHPLPKITLFPLFLLILGLGERPKITVIAIAAFFPMFINAALGVRSAEPGLLEVARSYGSSTLLTLRRVVLPGSLPAALAGLRLAFNSALTTTIALELLTAGRGIGSRVWIGWQNLRTDQLLAAMLVIAVLGWTANVLIERLQRRLTPWRT